MPHIATKGGTSRGSKTVIFLGSQPVVAQSNEDEKLNDNDNAASKREKSGARSGSSEREQGRPKVNDNVNLKTNH